MRPTGWLLCLQSAHRLLHVTLSSGACVLGLPDCALALPPSLDGLERDETHLLLSWGGMTTGNFFLLYSSALEALPACLRPSAPAGASARRAMMPPGHDPQHLLVCLDADGDAETAATTCLPLLQCLFSKGVCPRMFDSSGGMGFRGCLPLHQLHERLD